MNTHCLNCGKAIPKRGGMISFIPATANGRQNGERDGVHVFLDTDQRPQTREEAAKYTNHPIKQVTSDRHGINVITFDDGSRIHPYFHNKACGFAFGEAAAQAGFRKS